MPASIRWRAGAPLSFRLIVLLFPLASMSGCAGGYALVHRDTAGLSSISWLSPLAEGDSAALGRWRASVGAPVLPDSSSSAVSGDRLTLIGWNVAVGDGDIARLVNGLDRTAPLVLLLQEAYRGGPSVPHSLGPLSAFAGRLGARRPGQDDVERTARALGLRVYYVPSMRNGAPSISDEDRGNAILSNLPLSDLEAIELPFERQRRVAVAATVSGRSSRGVPWTVRVVSAHLDNMLGVQRLLMSGGEYARARQSRGLVHAFDGVAPLVLGGDFNTWFGFSDRAYLETVRSFPQTAVTDRRPTFMGVLRLDHLFFRLPSAWRAEFHRGNDRFGSDHFPLIASIDVR